MVEANKTIRLLVVTTIADTLRAFLLPFAYYFRSKGWQVDAMAQGVSNSPECLQAFNRVWEIEWSRNPLAPKNLILAPKIIREVVAQSKYDLVHLHTPVAAFVGRYALNNLRKKGKCKIIYTAHGFHFHPRGNPLKNAIFLNIEKIAGNWTDYLTLINHQDELAANKYSILSPRRIRYMPGIGIDLKYYNPDNVMDSEVGRVRQELRIGAGDPLFLCVAEFIDRKHHRDVIEALAKLARPQVHLVLAGHGRLLEEMQKLASDLGIINLVHFLGQRNDIPALMRASVATILASEQEGLPRSVMESLSMEIPVIGTKIRGIQELLEGGCGLLVEVGDIEEIAKAMAWILDRPEEAKAMGKQGRERMAAYDLCQVIKLHEELYAEALA